MKSIFTLILLAAYFTSLAQPGSLLSSFGNSGKVQTDMGSSFDLINDIAVQNDGKIIVVGRTGTVPNYDFAVARYNPDGTLDGTFDSDGKVVTTISSTSDVAYAVAIQNDGKILVSGGANSGPNSTFCVVRYNGDGSLDNTFDGDGILLGPFPATFSFAGQAIALQNDGKILVGGAVNGDQLDFAVARLNPNGSLDNSFDNDGYAQTSTNPGSVDQGFKLAVQTDGKILMGGRIRQTAPSLGPFQIALIRYNADGSLDNNFAAGGIFILSNANENTCYGLAVQTDGKIVLGGYSSPNGDGDFAVMRLTSNGMLDNSFDGDGIVTTDFYGANDWGRSLKMQTDGKIILSGSALNGTDQNFALARYNIDGSLDNTFGIGGKYVVANTGNEDAYGMGMFGTNIYLGGGTTVGSGSDFFLTAHLNDAGAIPLPLAFFSFTATKRAGAVQLQWETGFEINTCCFYVEQSTDGLNYNKIGHVVATGNSSSGTVYNFTTSQEARTTIHYRLRAVDKDQKFTFSKTVSVKGQEAVNGLKVFPNPARNTLQIRTFLKSPLQLIIYDMSGKIVKQVKGSAQGGLTTFVFSIAELSKGVYCITLNGADVTEKVLFTKE
jgi:uncharacterized delta-60 repeat protein